MPDSDIKRIFELTFSRTRFLSRYFSRSSLQSRPGKWKHYRLDPPLADPPCSRILENGNITDLILLTVASWKMETLKS